jgi:acyl-coenzyme A synthetase/AMP-(fatty) acid ligase
MKMNAAALLLEAGEAQHTALACGSENITYEGLREATARAASAWRRRGLERGERVAVKLPDSIPWVSAFLGAIWAGGVAVAVNPRIPAHDWQQILSEHPFRFILAKSREEMPPEYRDQTVTLDEWLREARTAPPIAPETLEQDAPALWIHSSGTSGRPKAVVHAHRFALEVDRVASELLGVHAGDRLFASSKMFFAYALGNSLLSGLKLGATIILDPEWPTAASVAASIAAQRPTVFFCVPSLYRNLLKEGFGRQIADLGVRACVSAGEALPTSLRNEWRNETGISIFNGYGASETLSLVLVNGGAGEGFAQAPGVEIKSLGQSVDGAPTRILIRSSTLALGYWHRPEADAENYRDGAFCPADLFQYIESDGWRFCGREDSLVKISGRWVNLVELEERLIAACQSIAEAAAAAVPDNDGVAAIAIFYVLKSNAPADAEIAVHAYAKTLPHYQRPRWLKSTDALPRTATGKLLRRGLREMLD